MTLPIAKPVSGTGTPTYRQSKTVLEEGHTVLGEPRAGGGPLSEALLEVGGKTQGYGQGHTLPGTYNLPDERRFTGAEITNVGVLSPLGEKGGFGYQVRTPEGDDVFVAYSQLIAEPPPTLGQRLEQDQGLREQAAAL